MFTQRRLFRTLSFSPEADGVVVEEKGLASSRSYRVPYEAIPEQPAFVAVASMRRLILTAICGLATAGTAVVVIKGGDAERAAPLVWGALTVLAGLWYWASRQSYVVFGEGSWALVLHRDRPSAAATQAFIADLLDHRRRHLASRYGHGSDSAVDRLSKAAGLRAHGLISSEEYDRLKDEILPKGPSGDGDRRLH